MLLVYALSLHRSRWLQESARGRSGLASMESDVNYPILRNCCFSEVRFDHELLARFDIRRLSDWHEYGDF